MAVWYEDGELRLVSEVQAGWYRYVSDWRLRDDGVIGPRFGFAGTRNPHTCMPTTPTGAWTSTSTGPATTWSSSTA